MDFLKHNCIILDLNNQIVNTETLCIGITNAYITVYDMTPQRYVITSSTTLQDGIQHYDTVKFYLQVLQKS